MIKKFDEFLGKGCKSLNEKVYSTNEYDYVELTSQLMSDCAHNNIEIVKELGGKFEIKNNSNRKFCFYKQSHGKYGDVDMSKIVFENIVSFEIDDDLEYAEDLFGESMLYDDDGEFLVAITDDGERIPIDYWTCPYETTLSINTLLTYYQDM
jgi:hypothetical protein